MSIYFFYEEIDKFKFDSNKTGNWVLNCIKYYKKTEGDLNFIFTSDTYLLNINKQFLQHNYYTDIITFDYCVENTISGDIYISIDRVKENAIKYHQTFEQELHRVIIHGVLHLIGLNDHTEVEKKEMRNAENECLKRIILIR